VSGERESVIKELQEAMSEERKLLTADAEQISLKVVDHAIFRVAELVGVALIAVFVEIILLLWITRRLLSERRRNT
jgi:hypothetical protein